MCILVKILIRFFLQTWKMEQVRGFCVCGKKADLACGRCTATKYCGKECQKEDWQFHKQHCDLDKKKELIEIYNVMNAPEIEQFLRAICYHSSLAKEEVLNCCITRKESTYNIKLEIDKKGSHTVYHPTHNNILVRLVDKSEYKKTLKSFVMSTNMENDPFMFDSFRLLTTDKLITLPRDVCKGPHIFSGFTAYRCADYAERANNRVMFDLRINRSTLCIENIEMNKRANPNFDNVRIQF